METSKVSPRPKLIYFAERPRHLDHDGFIDRWRRHARLGMSMPRWRNIHRYVHCDSLPMPESTLPIAWCDGVAMLWYRSDAARLQHISDPSAGPLLKQDERETFARPVREVSVLTDEIVFRPFDCAPLKLFLRVSRNPEQDQPAFRGWWLGEFAPCLLQRLNAGNVCRGYSQNHGRAISTDKDQPMLCDCVDEIACADPRVCERRINTVLNELMDTPRYVGGIKAIWTKETVLFGD